MSCKRHIGSWCCELEISEGSLRFPIFCDLWQYFMFEFYLSNFMRISQIPLCRQISLSLYQWQAIICTNDIDGPVYWHIHVLFSLNHLRQALFSKYFLDKKYNFDMNLTEVYYYTSSHHYQFRYREVLYHCLNQWWHRLSTGILMGYTL